MSKKKHAKRETQQGTERLLLGLVIGIFIGLSWYFLKDRLPELSNSSKKPAVAHHKKSIQTASVVADKNQPKFDFYTILPDGKTQMVKTNSAAPVPVKESAEKPAEKVVSQAMPEKPVEKVVSQATIEKSVEKAASEKPAKQTASQGVTAPISKPIVPPMVQRATLPKTKAFIVQIGSFNHLEDAERAKAELTLEGYSVTAQQVSNNNRLFYRVFIGPYSKQQEALRATEALAKLNYHGLILAR